MPRAKKTPSNKPPIDGLYYHKPSGQYFAYIGYHQVSSFDKSHREVRRRVRTTCYFGNSAPEATARFYQTKG